MFNMIMKKYILIIIYLIVSFISTYGQNNARNGGHLPTHGKIRFFVVFAEAVGYTKDIGSQSNWTAGQMPDNPDDYFDHEFTSEANINGYVTWVLLPGINALNTTKK